MTPLGDRSNRKNRVLRSLTHGRGCNVFGADSRNPSTFHLALPLHQPAAMDPTEFARQIARAQTPRLIPGIYNYCDGRCGRCAFTERCLVFLENREVVAERASDPPLGTDIEASLERTIAVLTEIAAREGVDLNAIAGDDGRPPFVVLDHEDDPLVARAREYCTFAWRVSRAVAPLVAARGEVAAIEAVETIEWFSSRIAAKIYRAVCGRADGVAVDADVQTDYDGSAKAALAGIDDSRRAWRALMEVGQATADGVPARAVQVLEELETAVRARFPRADAFVRPGFDEPAIAAGAAATLPPWARRPPPGER